MRDTIHLEPSLVPAHLRGTYTGKGFKAVICESVHIPIDAGLWSGGTREKFHAVRLSDGAILPLPGQDLAPWDAQRAERQCTLIPGLAIVEHSVFCGKDMGLTFYLLAGDAAPLLPAPAPELTEAESVVLRMSDSYKAAFRREYAFRAGVDVTAYDAAVLSLQGKGLLSASKAITTRGRNVASALERKGVV